MADPIRIGVIGVGMIGKHHLHEYAKIHDAKVVAVADVNEAEAQRVAGEFKIPTAYGDFRKLLASKEIDAVDVCLHNNLHAPVTIEALNAGKNVYCEKPMSGAYADSKAMYDAAKKTGKLLHIQLSTLYTIEHKTAKRLISEGHLGNIYYGRAFGFRRRGRPFVDGYGTPSFVQKQNSGGGALFDMGVYHIAAALDLLGNPTVETISGSTHQELAMYDDRAKSSNYNVEEIGLGFCRLGKGVTFAIEESWAVHYDGSESTKILGSKGGIKMDPFTFFSSIGDVESTATIDTKSAQNRWYSTQAEFKHYDGSQQHWIAAQQGIVPLIDTAGIALNVSLISEGIYLSQQLKRELRASEVAELSKSTALKI